MIKIVCHSFIFFSPHSSWQWNSSFQLKRKKSKAKTIFIHNKSQWMSNALLRQPLQHSRNKIYLPLYGLLSPTHTLSFSFDLFVVFLRKKETNLLIVVNYDCWNYDFMMCVCVCSYVGFSLANEYTTSISLWVHTHARTHAHLWLLPLQSIFSLVFVTFVFQFRPGSGPLPYSFVHSQCLN